MSKFAVPQPGSVITVTTRYANHYYKRDKDYEDTTYEHVPVLPPQKWTKPGSFCIPAENEPFITFRTISIDKVIALEVHEGEEASSDLTVGTHHVPVKGSGDKVYTVVVVDGHGKSCDCLGFTYRKDCRHLRLATGEHPINPRRETVKKQKRKAAAAKRKPRSGAPTKADHVREMIRKNNGEHCQAYVVEEVVKKIGMSRSLAMTYVRNNWSKA